MKSKAETLEDIVSELDDAAGAIMRSVLALEKLACDNKDDVPFLWFITISSRLRLGYAIVGTDANSLRDAATKATVNET